MVMLHDGKMNQQLFWQLANHCNGGWSVALCSHVPQPFAGTASVVKFFVGLLGLIYLHCYLQSVVVEFPLLFC
jgi:hypothetical protein